MSAGVARFSVVIPLTDEVDADGARGFLEDCLLDGFTVGGTVTDEAHEGWANRETWAFWLHATNDQDLYNYVLRLVPEARAQWPGVDGETNSPPDRFTGEFVVNGVRAMVEDMRRGARILITEAIGSWWRIDHVEIGGAASSLHDETI